jgi:hypothetical protein
MGELVTGLGTKLYAAKLNNLGISLINIILFRVAKTNKAKFMWCILRWWKIRGKKQY